MNPGAGEHVKSLDIYTYAGLQGLPSFGIPDEIRASLSLSHELRNERR